jgi:hypothetical protein
MLPFLRGRFEALRHGGVQRERVVRHRGQRRVVTVISGQQHDLEVVPRFLHVGDAPRRRGCLQVLRLI